MPAEHSISLHLPCNLRYLSILRDATLEFCLSAGLSEFQGYQVEMAVDEACANVIRLSYGGECEAAAEASHPGFLVKITEQIEELVVEIVDRGAGFNVSDVVEPEIKESTDGEIGFFVIDKFVDHVDYQRGTQDGNRLILKKKR
jgi:anti-sigma regulatory factor (Ser/Thr protein kinase)